MLAVAPEAIEKAMDSEIELSKIIGHIFNCDVSPFYPTDCLETESTSMHC